MIDASSWKDLTEQLNRPPEKGLKEMISGPVLTGMHSSWLETTSTENNQQHGIRTGFWMFTHRAQGHHHEEKKAQHSPHLQQQHKAGGGGEASAEVFCCLIRTKVLWRNWNTQKSFQVNDLFMQRNKARKKPNPHSWRATLKTLSSSSAPLTAFTPVGFIDIIWQLRVLKTPRPPLVAEPIKSAPADLGGVVTRINAVIHESAGLLPGCIYPRAERRKHQRRFETAQNFPVRPPLCDKVDK